MKKLILIPLALLFFHSINAQTDGISYQAVIIDNEIQELPGVDLAGNYLSEEPVTLKFTIENSIGITEYQEIQETMTDRYGMINLTIGQGMVTSESAGLFEEIEWDGNPKDLIVELSYDNEQFEELSNQALLFVPYASHRNITASGNLTVDQETQLYDSLIVQDHGNVLLTGNLTVLDTADFQGTTIFNSIIVRGTTLLQQTLDVDSITRMNDQVTITASLGSDDTNYANYPLRVQGSANGIAVKTNTNDPDGSKNFITFFDESETARGRIEGQTAGEVATSAEYLVQTAILTANIVSATAGVTGAITSSTVCAGAGVCVTAPIPSLNVSSGVNLASHVANMAAYQAFAYTGLGVTYESGSADYAEWLERQDPGEVMEYGEIVRMNGGMITKSTGPAERYMVISHRPAVLGNMPPEGKVELYEKVAFMGQVPVKVYGPVSVGDYILPSELGDGFGIAIHPDRLKLDYYDRIVGVAWSSSPAGSAGYVNVAIGMNQNDLLREVQRQDAELEELRNEMAEIRVMITGESADKTVLKEEEKFSTEEGQSFLTAEEMHGELSQIELEEAFAQVKELMIAQGVDVDNHPYYGPLFNDPIQKQSILDKARALIDQHRDQSIDYDRERGY